MLQRIGSNSINPVDDLFRSANSSVFFEIWQIGIFQIFPLGHLQLHHQ